MSIHKLTAGSGYDYLTRQVAALDATHKGQVGFASYYTERGPRLRQPNHSRPMLRAHSSTAPHHRETIHALPYHATAAALRDFDKSAPDEFASDARS
jgi:hypothetical protein